jgi:hypothetical protein
VLRIVSVLRFQVGVACPSDGRGAIPLYFLDLAVFIALALALIQSAITGQKRSEKETPVIKNAISSFIISTNTIVLAIVSSFLSGTIPSMR